MNERDTLRVSALSMHRFLHRIALGASNILAWVVIFQMILFANRRIEYALALVVALYALSQFIVVILTPLSGMALRFGIRRALFIGTLIRAASYVFIACMFIDSSAQNIFGASVAFAVFHGIGRALYWIPYAVSMKTVQSPFTPIKEALIILAPALGGWLIAGGNSLWLFGASAALAFLSIVPLFWLYESYESFDWDYRLTWRELVARSNNLAVGLFILDGIQGAGLLLIWPLAAFLVLNQSFQSLGALLTATLCISFLGRYLVRALLQFVRANRSPAVLATIVFSSWIGRLAAGTPIQLLVADVAYHSGSSPTRFSVDPFASEQAADGGHFVDEYTAIKEMGLAIGRGVVCLLFLVLVLQTSEPLAFAATILTAAIAGAWSVFLAHRLQKVI